MLNHFVSLPFCMSFVDSLIDNQKTVSNILPITNGIDKLKSKLIMNGHEMNGNNNYLDLNYDDHNDHDNESLNSNCKFKSDYCVNVAQLVCWNYDYLIVFYVWLWLTFCC